MEAKESVLDRLEQSIILYKRYFLELSLPIFLFYFLSGTFFKILASYFSIFYLGDQFFTNLHGYFASGNSGLDIFTLILGNSKIVFLFTISTFFLLLWLILFIPFKLALIKSIKQGYDGEKINLKQNIIWGFYRIIDSFKTYLYMFIYVYMIPSLVFIVLGLFFITMMFSGNMNFDLLSVLLFPISLLVLSLIFFILYRSVKVIFAIISAASNDDFTKENFDTSVKITSGKWWRIIGNLLLISIIVGLFLSLFSGLFNLLTGLFFSNNTSPDLLKNLSQMEAGNIGAISKIMESINLKDSITPSLSGFISSSFSDIIHTLKEVFITIFVFIFFKRLYFESKIESKENLNI